MWPLGKLLSWTTDGDPLLAEWTESDRSSVASAEAEIERDDLGRSLLGSGAVEVRAVVWKRPRARVACQRALDHDDVRGEVVGGPGVARLVDQSFAVEEAQLLIVARWAHADNERRAVNADL
jgi:hypothetical protein